MYEKSYMHRDVLTFVDVSKYVALTLYPTTPSIFLSHGPYISFPFSCRTGYIMTTSVDGYLKFWKKIKGDVDFIKQYRSHMGE